MCKYWNKELGQCVHPILPQKGKCDWDGDCPYYADESDQEPLVDVYPKCPHCNVELEYHDQLSTDYDDMYYFVNWSAFCPQCQHTFTFVEDFKLVERRFLNEEDSN